MATINVKDASGSTVAIEKPLAPGRAAATASRPVTLATEDKAALDALATQATVAAVLAKIISAPSTEAKQDTVIAALATIAGLVDGLEALLSAATPAGANVIGKVDHSTSGIGHGLKTVAAAGTAVALATSTPAKWVTVQAQTDNTGIIAVGGAGVLATVATGTGVVLEAGESITLPIDNLADVFIDATVSGDGARFVYGA
jgi:hypothetical protein